MSECSLHKNVTFTRYEVGIGRTIGHGSKLKRASRVPTLIPKDKRNHSFVFGTLKVFFAYYPGRHIVVLLFTNYRSNAFLCQAMQNMVVAQSSQYEAYIRNLL